MSKRAAFDWMYAELKWAKDRQQYRALTDTEPLEDGWLLRNGRKMLNLASNHYLGLDQRMDMVKGHLLKEAISGTSSSLRIGSTASRLIVGNDPIFTQFEKEFANFKGTESCLLFSSGYIANIGAISALVGRNDVVFSDRLNHASIVDGILLSRAEHVRYRHRDLEHLESQLRKAAPDKKKLIVTDAVFSMDGSVAPLKELVELKERYNAMLMVDEAHSGGVYGTDGQGLAYEMGLSDHIEIQMGTFSKAYGCYGAYIAGDEVLKHYLINKSRSFIYTTALPPLVIAAVRRNWLQAREEGWRRTELRRKSAWFRQALRQQGFDIGISESHIVPLLVGDNERTVRFCDLLQDEGIAAVAIRPPTVPEGTARVRFTLMATHRDEDLKWAVERIGEWGRKIGLIE